MLILFDLGCVAFLLALLLTPPIRGRAIRFGLVDRPCGRKIHDRPIPRVGGVAIMGAYALSCVFIIFAPYFDVSIDLNAGMARAAALFPAVALVFCTGLLDDVFNIRPWQKLIGQVAAALVAHMNGFGIYVFRDYALGETASLLITVAWLVGCSNALNLVDGMDGLATGIALFASATSLVAALVHNSLEMALVTAPLVGALIGFLRYNFNPASIFLGDSGSLTIGFLLGCYGALWSHKSATLLAMSAPLIAYSIPLLEMLLSISRRFLRRQPIFGADRRHMHHLLLARGLTTRRAVLLLYACSAAAAIFALLFDLLPGSTGILLLIVIGVIVWMGIKELGYTEFGVASRLLLRGDIRAQIDVHVRLRELEDKLNNTGTIDEAWEVLAAAAPQFGVAHAEFCLESRVRATTGAPGDIRRIKSYVPLPNGYSMNFSQDEHAGAVTYAVFIQKAYVIMREKFGQTRRSVEPEKVSSSAWRAEASAGASLAHPPTGI